MRIIILEGREEQALELGSALICEGEICLCATGRAAQNTMMQNRADVVILGFPVTDMDTLAFVDWEKKNHPKTKLVVCTDFLGSFFLNSLGKRKVDLVLSESWQTHAVCAHIRSLLGTDKMRPEERRWIQSAMLLHNLGIPRPSKGFSLFQRAVLGGTLSLISPEDKRIMADTLSGADSPLFPCIFPEGRKTVSQTVAKLSELLSLRDSLFS